MRIGLADDLAFGDEGVDLAGHGGGSHGEVFGDLLVGFGLGLNGDEDAEVVEGEAVLLAVALEVQEAEEVGWGVGFHGLGVNGSAVFLQRNGEQGNVPEGELEVNDVAEFGVWQAADVAFAVGDGLVAGAGEKGGFGVVAVRIFFVAHFGAGDEAAVGIVMGGDDFEEAHRIRGARR
jgi:hypothetical protein